MSLDGAFLHIVTNELQPLIGARVDKVYQPSREEIVVSLRTFRDGGKKIVLSANSVSAPLGFFYKAANTMDSMIGYTSEKYLHIGRFAAKLDDVLNYIPSRLTALLMILSAGILKLDIRNAWKIWRRDRRKHASPNSAQTEAVCAGALRVRLAGNAWYFGKLHRKPFIGDDIREIENEDIRRANRLMYCTSVLMLALCTGLRAILWGCIL